jgi:uncharacterized protein Yka (UPF0111/DUF47 family)
MPNFYGLIDQQCELSVRALSVFVDFMTDGSPENAARVREIEKEGDVLKQRNIDILNQAFATPMDREDIFRAINSIDHVVNYAKTTVREMELLGVEPDEHSLAMAQVLEQGVQSLRDGYAKLSTEPTEAEVDAQAVRKAERNAEKAYRKALAALFDEETHTAAILESSSNGHSLAEVVATVMSIFKRREIYRHLSNAADRLARAGGALHDIVVKIS